MDRTGKALGNRAVQVQNVFSLLSVLLFSLCPLSHTRSLSKSSLTYGLRGGGATRETHHSLKMCVGTCACVCVGRSFIGIHYVFPFSLNRYTLSFFLIL